MEVTCCNENGNAFGRNASNPNWIIKSYNSLAE